MTKIHTLYVEIQEISMHRYERNLTHLTNHYFHIVPITNTVHYKLNNELQIMYLLFNLFNKIIKLLNRLLFNKIVKNLLIQVQLRILRCKVINILITFKTCFKALLFI